MMYQISNEEFSERIKKTQEAMVAAGLDILICYGNEAEPQYVRYYSDYWPSFESACVMIPQEYLFTYRSRKCHIQCLLV